MRQNGYYWVKFISTIENEPQTENGWQVAYFYNGDWCSICEGIRYKDHDLLEIDETRLIRK